MKSLITVKDKQGNIYTMPSETSTCILEIHYSTSYYQFEVQDTVEHENGMITYPQKTIIVPINKENWLDFLAVKESEIGELVKELEDGKTLELLKPVQLGVIRDTVLQIMKLSETHVIIEYGKLKE